MNPIDSRYLPRLAAVIALLLLLSFSGWSVMAQEDEPAPEPAPTASTEEMLRQVQDALRDAEEARASAEAALAEAEEANERAGEQVDMAGNLFGLFEAFSVLLGMWTFIIPVLALIAGFLGFTSLRDTQNQLRQAQADVEAKVAERTRELDHLRDELEKSLEHQRQETSRSAIAQSLLPLAEKQYKAQDYKGALDTYQRALKLAPDNPATHYRMGYVYTQSGKLEEAEKHLSQALQLDPDFAPARAARGYVYRRIAETMPEGLDRDQMLNEAERNFQQALKISPKLVDEDGESWWGALGGLYRRREQVDQAIYAYRQGAEVTPQSSYPFSNLALLYMKTGNRQKMMDTYVQVERLAAREVQADVDNYWAYADLIVARMALGQVEAAWEVLDTALGVAPEDSPYTLESLVETLQRLSSVMVDDSIKREIKKVIDHIQAFRESQREQRKARATGESPVVSDT